ncbi:ribonuclease H-like domain-containing protein [Tanacetum coccineum]
MLHGVEFEVKPQEDRGFEVEPIGICDLRDDSQTEIRTAKSFLNEVKKNILGMGIFKNHNENGLSGNRDEDKKSKGSCIYVVGSHEYKVVSTIRDITYADINHKLNVNSAFLYGDLDETIYMKLLDGYYPGNDTRVCRLKKSLYGLKQAPKQWNAKLTSALTKNGISQSKSDYSFLGKGFLCIKVNWDTKGRNLISNQRKYCLDLLSEFGMFACKPLVVPLPSKLVISNEPIDDDPLVDNITEYKKLIANPVFHERTKHLEIDLHFVRLKILAGVVKIEKVEYANQIPDILTK